MKVALRYKNAATSLGMAKFLICLCGIMGPICLQAAPPHPGNIMCYQVQQDPEDAFMHLFWYNLERVKQIDYTQQYISANDYAILQHTRMQIEFLLNCLADNEKVILWKMNIINSL